MPSLTANFDELLTRIRHGRSLGSASFEPIYYLIFSPKEILEVKRRLPAWTARLHQDGWDVHRFSVAVAVEEILQTAKLRQIWLTADRKAPQNWEKTNKSLANALTQGALQGRLETLLESVNGRHQALVLVTDLEALHPYMRIGAIESQLYGKFNVPTIILYPGERVGKSGLKFLGFYPQDGNYRSVHVGG
ncbi:MAG: DUF1788 domain-containing protein [Anaerolineae bacterium]|nr:DUF1788 domain-containing protein [Anaerolineae bacterium]